MKRNLLLLFFVFLFANVFSLDSLSIKKRTVALLDLTARNAEINDGELYSAIHILKVAGIPFVVTTNVNTAIKYGTVIPSSRFETTTTFTTAEKDSIISYVNKGGILIGAIVRDPYFYSLFGISSQNTAFTRHRVIFDTSLADQSMRWLNDTMETTISLGSLGEPVVITTKNYILSSAQEMAHYDDLTSAVIRNNYGAGTAYALGFSFKNLVLINQINKDYDAQRIYSNGFEPSTDALILFLKGICTKHTPNSVWLHTSPYETKSALMITHDVDATTAFDTMALYADYENSIGLSSTYLITTHYLDDGALADFYNPTSIPKVQYLITKGHKLASHSVGHFTDFDNDTIFPMGVLGNTTTTYLPYNAGTSAPTVGGTILGETEVSKNLLQSDFGVNIRTFRAGYLAYNKRLVNGLDTLGYEYNSSFAAGDVLTTFPYRNHKNRNSAGDLTNVWELPVTISDVFAGDPISFANYSAKQAIWLDVINRDRANNAPAVLLIHPNRTYKLWAEQDLIAQLPPETFISDLETFADYWKGRDSIQFSSQISNDTLTVTIPSFQLPLNTMISFIVDNGQDLGYIKAQDENNIPISVVQSTWDDNGLILHFGYYTPLGVAANNEQYGLTANCFPNPFTTSVSIEIVFKEDAPLTIDLYNVMGQLVQHTAAEKLQGGVYHHSITSDHLAAGTYYCKIHSGTKSIVKKIILLQQ